MGTIGEIIVTAVIAILLLLVEHYWPWKAILRKPLGILPRYVSGVLALQIPLSLLFLYWGAVDVIYAMWVVTVSGGAAVYATHRLDRWIETRDLLREALNENQTLRGLIHGPDDE